MFSKKKNEEKISIEEEKFREQVRKEQQWREQAKKKDVSTETHSWHHFSNIFGTESGDMTEPYQRGREKATQTGKDTVKMSEKEEQKKVVRQLKNEKKRLRILDRKRELDLIEQRNQESRKKFIVEMKKADEDRKQREREKAEERQKMYRRREIEANRRDQVRKQKQEERRKAEARYIKIQKSVEDMQIQQKIILFNF